METLNPRQFRKPRPVPLRQLEVTALAAAALTDADIRTAVIGHSKAHWGFVDDQTWETNDLALSRNGRVRSVYLGAGGVPFWVITHLPYRISYVALPCEYS